MADEHMETQRLRGDLETLRSTMASCLAAVSLLEYRLKSADSQALQLSAIERLQTQMDGQLGRLLGDLRQLDHVVQTANGTTPLTITARDHAAAIAELLRWRAQYEVLLIGLETTRLQGATATKVATLQGLTATKVALLTGGLAGLTALLTALAVWLTRKGP